MRVTDVAAASSRERIGRWLDPAVAGCLVLALPAAALSARLGGVVFWILALLGLARLLAGRGRDPRMSLPDAAIWLAACAPVLLNLSSVLVFGLPWRALSWGPMLGLPLIAAAAAPLADPLRLLWRGAVAACVVALASAGYSRFVLGEPLPAYMMNPILFGQIAFVATVIAAWGLAETAPRWLRESLVLAPLAGLAALLMSGYRGALPALPFLVASFLRLGERGYLRAAGLVDLSAARPPAHAPWRAALAVLVVAGALLLVARPQVGVIDRLGMVEREVSEFSQGRVGFTSIGTRFALWQASVTLIEERPVFGTGAHRFREALATLKEQGRFPADAKLYDHAHNTVLSIAVEFGMIGVAMFVGCLVVFLRRLARLPLRPRALAFSLAGCWAVFGLTNDIFAHQTAIRTAALVFGACLAAGLAAGRRVPALAEEPVAVTVAPADAPRG